jgi:hypothetical protein
MWTLPRGRKDFKPKSGTCRTVRERITFRWTKRAARKSSNSSKRKLVFRLISDTLVYSVLFSDPDAYGSPVYYPSPGMGRRSRMPMPPPGGGQDLPDGKKVLRQIAKETGGRFYQVGRSYWPLGYGFRGY